MKTEKSARTAWMLSVGLTASLFMAATVSIATSAQARTVTKPSATGIGYASSGYQARRLAIHAWEKAVFRKWGRDFADFKKSASPGLSCERTGSDNSYGFRSHRKRDDVIGQLGDVNASWTCTATAYPTAQVAFPDSYPPNEGYKPVVTGIGYARSEAGAGGLAVRAWTNAASREYGPAYARYSAASEKSLDCDYIGGSREYGARSAKRRDSIIGEEGNVNSPWTCTARGRPQY